MIEVFQKETYIQVNQQGVHGLRGMGWRPPTREIGCGGYHSVSRLGTILYFIHLGFMEEYGCCWGVVGVGVCVSTLVAATTSCRQQQVAPPSQ